MNDLRILLGRLKFALLAALLLAMGIGFSRYFYVKDDYSIAATTSPRLTERTANTGAKVDYSAVGVTRPKTAQRVRKLSD